MSQKEFIRGRQTRFGQNGNFGGIPPEYVAKKYEVTQLYEPENMLDEHFRSVLKDNTCEPPSLESDQPRYDHGAKNLINVMYEGSRSKVKPDMPEIYIANTTPDPRGIQTMPDMRRATVDATMARMKYKDLRSTATSDQSVDSGVWAPHAINQAMRGTWKGLKNREKWFSRSLSAKWPGIMQRPTTHNSAMNYVEQDDEKHHELAEVTTQVFTPSEVVFGRGWTPVIVGARSVPTQELTVAKYGDMPRSAVYKYDASKNLWKAVPTKDFEESEELTLRGLARVMAGEAGCRAVDANPSHAFDRSAEGMHNSQTGKQANVRKALDSAEHTQEIVEHFVLIAENKKRRAQTSDDLKQQRLHRIIDTDMYSEGFEGNHASIRLIDDPFAIAHRRYYQLAEIDAEDSTEIPCYASAPVPTIDRIRAARGASWVDIDAEESMRVSRGKTNLHAPQQKNNVREMRDIDETVFRDADIASRLIGPIGEKDRIRRHLRFEPSAAVLADINAEAGNGAFKRGGAFSKCSRSLTIDSGEPNNEPMHVDMVSARI